MHVLHIESNVTVTRIILIAWRFYRDQWRAQFHPFATLR